MDLDHHVVMYNRYSPGLRYETCALVDAPRVRPHSYVCLGNRWTGICNTCAVYPASPLRQWQTPRLCHTSWTYYHDSRAWTHEENTRYDTAYLMRGCSLWPA